MSKVLWQRGELGCVLALNNVTDMVKLHHRLWSLENGLSNHMDHDMSRQEELYSMLLSSAMELPLPLHRHMHACTHTPDICTHLYWDSTDPPG